MPVVSYLTVDGEILSEMRSGVRTDYLNDPLGSVVGLLSSSQTISAKQAYWPYGETRTTTGTWPGPFGFVGSKGYYSDAGGGIYVRSRVQEPALARWLTVDPLWPREAPYTYAMGNPTSYADPTGLLCDSYCFAMAARRCIPARKVVCNCTESVTLQFWGYYVQCEYDCCDYVPPHREPILPVVYPVIARNTGNPIITSIISQLGNLSRCLWGPISRAW